MAEEVAVEQQPVAVESKKRKRQPKAKQVEGQEAQQQQPKVVKQKKQKQSQQQNSEKVYFITESSLKEAHVQQQQPKEVAAKKEKKVRPKKRPEDIHSIPLDQLVSSTILALCMHCSYAKDENGKRIKVGEHEKKKNKKGEPKPLYKFEKRSIDINVCDDNAQNDKTLRVGGICKSCGGKCSLIVKKQEILKQQQ